MPIPFFSNFNAFSHKISSHYETNQIELNLNLLATAEGAESTADFDSIVMKCTTTSDDDKKIYTLSIDSIKSGTFSEILNLIFKDTCVYEGRTYTINKISNNCFSGTDSEFSEQLKTWVKGKINFSEKIQYIGNKAFNDLEAGFLFLGSEPKIVEIGDYAFRNCSNFTAINLKTCVNLTKIGNYSFANTGATKIEFPLGSNQSLTEIGEGAFEDNINIPSTESLFFPNKITKIGRDAFKNFPAISSIGFTWYEEQLKNVSFGNNDSLPTLDESSSLNYISVPEGTRYIYKMKFYHSGITKYDEIYDKFTGPDYRVNLSKIISTTITFSETVDLQIASFSFGKGVIITKINNPGILSNLIFSNFVRIGEESIPIVKIGDNSFKGWSQLTGKIVFPKSLYEIGDNAFLGKSLTEPMGITELDFTNCKSLLKVGDNAFKNCSNLGGEIMIPETVRELGSNAFENAGSFKNIVFGWDNEMLGNVKIGNEFSAPAVDRENDGKITIPLNSLYDYELFFDLYLSSLYEHEDIVIFETFQYKIEDVLKIKATYSTNISCQFDSYNGTAAIVKLPNVDYSCEIISIPKIINHNGSAYRVTTIGDNCFEGCKNIIGDIVFPSYITDIGSDAFAFTGITSISTEKDSNLTEIQKRAFKDCDKLSKVDIDDSTKLNYIGDYAFQNCRQLSGEFDMPASIIYLGESIFQNTGFFSNIYFHWNITQLSFFSKIDSDSLPNITIDGYISIPETLWSAYKDFFQKFYISKYSQDQIIVVDIKSNGSNVFSGDFIFDSFVNCTRIRGNDVEITRVDDDISVNNISFRPYFEGEDHMNYYVLKAIGNYAFSSCFNITGSVTFCNTLTTIGNSAFQGAPSKTMQISTLDFSKSKIETIGSNAFAYCKKLNGDIYFPSTVKTFGSDAFYNSGIFSSVTFNWTATQLLNGELTIANQNSLPNIKDGGTIYVPYGTCNLYLDFFKKNKINKYLNVKIIDEYYKEYNYPLIYGLTLGIGLPIEIASLIGIFFLIKNKSKKNK